MYTLRTASSLFMLWIDSFGSRPAIECPWGQGPRLRASLSSTVWPQQAINHCAAWARPGILSLPMLDSQEQPNCDPLHGSEPLAVPWVVCRILPGVLPGCCNTETNLPFLPSWESSAKLCQELVLSYYGQHPYEEGQVIDCIKPQLVSPYLFNILWPNKVFLLSAGKTDRHTVIIQAWLFSSHFLQNGQNKTCCSKEKPPVVFVSLMIKSDLPLSKISNFGKFVFATVSPTAFQHIRN